MYFDSRVCTCDATVLYWSGNKLIPVDHGFSQAECNVVMMCIVPTAQETRPPRLPTRRLCYSRVPAVNCSKWIDWIVSL
jgi:hypothetical protein